MDEAGGGSATVLGPRQEEFRQFRWARMADRRDPKGRHRVALSWIRTHDWDAEGWREKSLCRDSNIDVFFPVGTTGPAVDLIEAAKEICASCPVQHQCLEFALETSQEAGVWGGLTEEERRAIRKARLADERASAPAG